MTASSGDVASEPSRSTARRSAVPASADQAADRAGRPNFGAGLEPAAEKDEADDERRRVEVGLGLQAGGQDTPGHER